MPDGAEILFDYIKEEVTGQDKQGRIKMGNYYFDSKMFNEKLSGLGFDGIDTGMYVCTRPFYRWVGRVICLSERPDCCTHASRSCFTGANGVGSKQQKV
eukprot:SAG11_NODE_617_length_8185_cov_6.989859_2_plen_99_part_00